MTERCAHVRELAPEVALGVAEAADRALVLGHVAGCAGCRAYLAALSSVTDDVLLLAPSHEPPSGFESTVLARLGEPGGVPGEFRAVPGELRAGPTEGAAEPWLRRRLWRVVRFAVVVALTAALSGGAVYWADRPDRELASGLRQTLATAHGQYFAAFPLRDLSGERRGVVFGYQGDPAWLVCALDQPLPAGRYRVELVARDGATHRLADNLNLSGVRVWGTAIPVAVHEAALLRVLGDDGRLVLTARLIRG